MCNLFTIDTLPIHPRLITKLPLLLSLRAHHDSFFTCPLIVALLPLLSHNRTCTYSLTHHISPFICLCICQSALSLSTRPTTLIFHLAPFSFISSPRIITRPVSSLYRFVSCRSVPIPRKLRFTSSLVHPRAVLSSELLCICILCLS
jgi:hypothetical protein